MDYVVRGYSVATEGLCVGHSSHWIASDYVVHKWVILDRCKDPVPPTVIVKTHAVHAHAPVRWQRSSRLLIRFWNNCNKWNSWTMDEERCIFLLFLVMFLMAAALFHPFMLIYSRVKIHTGLRCWRVMLWCVALSMCQCLSQLVQ
jgi:hypothetical protein